jgi:hypothetical protein
MFRKKVLVDQLVKKLLLGSPKVCYHVHKSPPTGPYPQPGQVHTFSFLFP